MKGLLWALRFSYWLWLLKRHTRKAEQIRRAIDLWLKENGR